MISDQALAGSVVFGFAIPIVHRDLVEEEWVAVDGQYSAKVPFQRPISSGAPGNRRISGFDPAEIDLPQALTDNGNRGWTALLAALKDDDAQIDQINGIEDVEHGSVEDPLDMPTRGRTGERPHRFFERQSPPADQFVMGTQRLVEENGNVSREHDRRAGEVSRAAADAERMGVGGALGLRPDRYPGGARSWRGGSGSRRCRQAG